MTNQNIPAKQRALILQGAGALGAYDAGVFQAIYENLEQKDENKPLFDIVAGTSSGAMNAAILVSHVAENDNSWKGSADKLKDFWNNVSRAPGDIKIGIPQGEGIPGFNNWWKYWHKADSNIASEEAARRYYSSKEFLYTGVLRVFFPLLLPKTDNRFFDNFIILINNTWYVFSNQPLKESLKFSKFPISTSFEKDRKQPRLLLVSVDVLEGAAVTFDSYPKIDGSRKSEYGKSEYLKLDGDDINNNRTEYTIYYNEVVNLEHAIASGSVPINYDYAKIEADRLTIENRGNKKVEKVDRYFWDVGIASNTPLRELIQAHKDYWLDVMGIGKEDSQSIPDLEVFIVDVWPTKRKDIPLDHDGAINRNLDLLMCDKTDYDEKVANIVIIFACIILFFRYSQHNIYNLLRFSCNNAFKNSPETFEFICKVFVLIICIIKRTTY